MGQGYVGCPKCGFDFWVDVVIENDIITKVCTRKDDADYSSSKRPKYSDC